MTIFPQYEQQLRDLARSRSGPVTQPSHDRAPHRRWRVNVIAPALGVIVAIAVAAGALVSIGGHDQHAKAPAATSSPTGTTPTLSHHHTRKASLPLPVSSLSELKSILGVLRRPQVDSDRTDPLFKPHSPLRPILADERLLLSTPKGVRVWITPTHASRLTTEQARQIPDPVQFWFNARFPGGSAGAQVTAERIKDARAATQISNVTPGGNNTTVSPYSLALLVPDGVAKVIATAATTGQSRSITISATVHNNLAVLTFSKATAIAGEPRIRWFDRAGQPLPIPDPAR